ncbi:MAG: type II CAAX prenyl endopeptidase Rce1 family protein [Promethearchaeota archaeon]
MSGNEEKEPNACIYCKAKIKSGEIYCPKCGKLNKNLKLSETIQGKKEEKDFHRTCSGCGSIIASNKLLQCPICNTLLEKIPEKKKPPSQEKIGYVFNLNTSKTLQPELNKERWNIKEGLQVFEFTILLYFLIYITIIILIAQTGTDIQINFLTLMIELIPGSVLCIYPIFYIISKKNKLIKLGFDTNIKNNILAILIGIFGGIILFIFNFLYNFVFNSFVSIGFQQFIDYNGSLLQRQQVLQNSGLLIFLYAIGIITSIISIEIVYRGVLHKSLKEKFGNSILNKIIVVLIVALIYSVINSLALSFTYIFVSLFFLITNFIIFIILGMLFEINGNIYNTLIAHALFEVLVLITIFYL